MRFYLFVLAIVTLAIGCKQESGGSKPTAENAEASSTAPGPFMLDAALVKAKAENKPVLLEFTGSDWCPPCKHLEKTVLSTPEFEKFRQESIIFGKLDFPRSIRQSDEVKANNETLAERFQINAFPTLVLLNAEGKELWRMVGIEQKNSSAESLIAAINQQKK